MEFQSLRTAPPDLVNEVLRDEALLWYERLGWDFTSIQQSIYQAVCRGLAPGVLAMDGARPAGLAYYTREGDRGSLGNMVVAPRYRGTRVGRRLAHLVVAQMHEGDTLRRIESHTPFMEESGAGEALRGLGFEGVPRHFLTKSLVPDSRFKVGAGIRIEPLTPHGLSSAAEVMFSSLVGSLDAAINADFESVEGCERNLEALMAWPGCGNFDPASSGVATNAQGHAIGVIATTRLSRNRAIIGQISVRPEYQARGVGNALVSHACAALTANGLADVALTVTEENPAYEWYLRLGFSELHSFDAYVWANDVGATVLNPPVARPEAVAR